MKREYKFIIFLFLIAILIIVLFQFKTEQKEVENIQYGTIEIEKQFFDFAPKEVRAPYLTSWSGSSNSKINEIIDYGEQGLINSVVIDIKDFSGYIAYDTDIDILEEYDAERVLIKDIRKLIEKLHDNNIYVIARMVVFQDPILAYNRPDLAVKKGDRESIWYNYSGLAWTDPSSEEVWDYNIAIAKDAFEKGFDEINFDYIRFPSDGDLSDIYYPHFEYGEDTKPAVLKQFYSRMREALPSARLSIDLFGLTMVKEYDIGIGQILEDAAEYFDFICPMVYPSHYVSGFNGYLNPADYPYEVVYYSLEKGVKRIGGDYVKIRPWLQDFNLGADYDAEKVLLQINATKDALGEEYRGFMLWNPQNIYTINALKELAFKV